MEKSADSSSAAKAAKSDSESERIAQSIHEAIDRFTVHAAEAEQRVRDAATEAQVQIKAKRQTARRSVDEAEQAFEGYVDRHPWTALGVAFGAGVLISSLLRR